MVKETQLALTEDMLNQKVDLNIEYRDGLEYVTVRANGQDVGKGLIEEGLLMVDARRDPRVRELVADYQAAQDRAKREHKNIWQYGDVTDDDATEFGR